MQIAHANNALNEAKQSTRSVLQWISQRTNWLMVYDGADGHYQIVEKFLPPGNGGNIVITSRNGGLKRISLKSLEVVKMAEEEAISLLLKSAELVGLSDHDSNLARTLVSELSGIPLALDQAGAYMQATQCDIVDYLELYAKHKHALMSNSEFKGASDYDRTTYGTWDISMQNIEGMAATVIGEKALAAQSAVQILRIFAFLDHSNIPLELFNNAAENYMRSEVNKEAKDNLPSSMRLLDHQTLFLSRDGVWEKMKFLAGIQVLISFSLIEVHSRLYSMHKLVHAWNRNRIPRAEISHHYHKARAMLSCSIVHDYMIDNYVFCRLLAPQIRSNVLHASELGLKDTYYDNEYERFTLVFHHIGSWDEMEKLLLVMVKHRTRVLGPKHAKTLACIAKLASTYMQQGRWDEAEKMEVDVLNARKERLGSDHPDTLTSMASLAYTFRCQGRWDEAEKLEVKVMNARTIRLGSDHPDTLTSMTNLASTYRIQGRWKEAEEHEVDVMNGFKAKHGSDHPVTLTSMANLASTYWHQGRWDEAEKLEVDVMNVRMTKLGQNHPNTLTSIANVASTYWNQGKWDEAEKLEVDVMNAFKANIGPDHPDTLTSIANLASTYKNQGRLDEAEKLEVDVMNGFKAKLGSDHPATLTSMANLASTYRNQGRLDEAEILQVDVINARIAKLGSDHPDTLTSIAHLASTYWNKGLWDKAEKLQVEVMNARNTKLGFNHPDTLAIMANLAFTYQSQERLNEAHSLLSHAVKTMQQVVGTQHPTLLYYDRELDKLSIAKQDKEKQKVLQVCLHSGCFNLMIDFFCYNLLIFRIN